MNLLDKIIEELKQKAIIKNIPYDAFIYQECIEILKNNKEIYKEQIIKAVDYGYELDFSDDDNTYTKGEEYFYETFGDNAG